MKSSGDQLERVLGLRANQAGLSKPKPRPPPTANVVLAEGRTGNWFTYADEDGSGIEPAPAATFTVSEGGAEGSRYATRMHGPCWIQVEDVQTVPRATSATTATTTWEWTHSESTSAKMTQQPSWGQRLDALR